MSNETELIKIEKWVGGILAGLSPTARARATRTIAAKMRGSTATRIAAQRDAEGAPFAPRKAQKELKPSNKTLKFLYPAGGSGEARKVLLKSWVKQGPIYTGYDVERAGIRSFEKAKIIKHLPVTPEEANKGAKAKRKRATIKSRVMFLKLRTFGKLRAGSTANEAWVGYSGRDAAIAEVHQIGGVDQVGRKGARVRYAERRLLGLSKADEAMLLDIMIGMVDAR